MRIAISHTGLLPSLAGLSQTVQLLLFYHFFYQETTRTCFYILPTGTVCESLPDIEALQPRSLRRSTGLGCFAFARHY